VTAAHPPALVSCYFGNTTWPRQAAVLRLSAARQCPDWQIEITELPPPTMQQGTRTGDTANTQKLEHWAHRVEYAADGEELLCIDADTVIVRSLDAIWAQPFDLAYTTKPLVRGGFPFNSGVVFLRVNPVTRWFMSKWAAENRELYYRDRKRHNDLRTTYGGMNQAALGSLLEQRVFQASGMRVLELPCAEWNCEDSGWATFDPDVTRVLHVKAALRSTVLGPPTMPNPVTLRAATYWKALDREARGVEARAS